MGLLVCMVVMLLLMESGLIKVFAAGALLGLWLGCMRMVESESVKERKAGAPVRLWVKRGNDWVGVGYQDVHVFQGGGRGKALVCQNNAMEITKQFIGHKWRFYSNG